MTDYLHGYTDVERERLISQSRFLGPVIYENIDYPGCRKLLEVGCGVGAQLRLLLEKFPQLDVTGIDRSQTQIAAARQNLAAELAAGRAHLVHGNGASLPFAPGTFDAGFLCWVLEHAPERAALLRDFKRVLAPGARVYATEVFLASLFIRPEPTAFMRYWAIYSAFQEEIDGDPQVGPKLGGYFAAAGFSATEVYPIAWLLDAREQDPARRTAHWDYWQTLCHSAVPGLKAAGKVDDALVAALDADFARLRSDPEALFYITAMQARAEA